jgi:hypothetical protein
MARKRTEKQPSKVDQLVAKAAERAATAGVEIEPEMYSLEWYRQEWPARKLDFIQREIKIRNAFHKNKLEPFFLNDAQRELLDASIEASEDPSLEDCTLKGRRQGVSTYYCADYFADAVVESGHHVRIVAQDPQTLRTLMRTVKAMYDNLRPEIKPASKYNSVYDLEMNDPEKGVISSRISVSTVVPGQEEKGRGDTFTRLHLTEVPFWRGDAETAATALCDAAKGGKISWESTPKGVGDTFHKRYSQGRRREGGVRAHFFEWWWNPNYRIEGARFEEHLGVWYLLKANQRFETLDNEALDKARVSVYTDEERKRLELLMQSEKSCAEKILDFLKRKGYVEAGAEWHCSEVAERISWRRQEIEKKGRKNFRVEYPENDVDCFSSTGGSIFSECSAEPTFVQREAEPGHEYKLFLDPSNGVEGGDPYSIYLFDCSTGEIVYREGGIKKQDWQGLRCCELSDKYNACEIGIESNMGEAAILEVERLGYGHRLYKHIDAQAQRDIADGKISYRDAWLKAKPGLAMGDRIKRLIINNFEIARRRGEIRGIPQELIDQERVFVQDGEKMGAKVGWHDDEVIAAAGGWYLAGNSRTGSADYISTGEKLGSAQASAY